MTHATIAARIALVLSAGLIVAALGISLLPGLNMPVQAATTPARTDVGLPGRTPASATTMPLPTAPITPRVTSPFVFPSPSPIASQPQARDCTAIFPPDNVEAIMWGQTTLSQLEAAFGHATRERGRANRFRFEAEGCVLRALVGVQETFEVELLDYGTLGWLLDRYGPPPATGISQGNLTLRDIGHAVLLYPEAGITAIFAEHLDALTLDMPVATLVLRPPFEAQKQLTRLNVRPEVWIPPDSWSPASSSTPTDRVQ